MGVAVKQTRDFLRCDAMSQCPAMSADFVPRRCDAISIAGHTAMSDDAMQSDVAQAAMTSDVDVERKLSDVRFMSMCPDIAKPMQLSSHCKSMSV